MREDSEPLGSGGGLCCSGPLTFGRRCCRCRFLAQLLERCLQLGCFLRAQHVRVRPDTHQAQAASTRGKHVCEFVGLNPSFSNSRSRLPCSAWVEFELPERRPIQRRGHESNYRDCVCVCARVRACVGVYMHTCTHACLQIGTRAHTHTHRDTHTDKQAILANRATHTHRTPHRPSTRQIPHTRISSASYRNLLTDIF